MPRSIVITASVSTYEDVHCCERSKRAGYSERSQRRFPKSAYPPYRWIRKLSRPNEP